MVSLVFREHYELFDKVETGLKVKFDFSIYDIDYKKGEIIPIALAYIKDHKGDIAYSIYDDPASVEYTARINDASDIMLNGF